MSKTPSIAVIPSGYKASKVYSVLPTNGDADLDFTRNCVATRVNQNGLLEEVGLNVPRLDYSDGGCPSLLLEPQRTNLVTYSEDFSVASWSSFSQGLGSSPILNHNNSTSPNGEMTSTRFRCELNGGNSSNDRSYIKFSGLSSSPFSCAKSLYVKNNLQVEQKIFIGVNSVLDMFTLSVSSDWQRIEINGGVINTEIRLGIQGGSNNSDSVDVEIFGVQLEEGSYATSYIPTNGATVTRFKDEASKDNLESYINSSEGVLYFESKSFLNDGEDARISLSDGTIDNRIEFSYGNDGASNVYCLVVLNSENILFSTAIQLDDLDEYKKIAISYKSGDSKMYINGINVLSSNTTFTNSNTLPKLNFGNSSESISFKGNVKDLRVYNEALTDAELIELTTI